MVLGKLPVPGHPPSLDNNKTKAYHACRRHGWGLFGLFFCHLFSQSLLKTARLD